MSIPKGFITYYTNTLDDIIVLINLLASLPDYADVSKQQTIDSINRNLEILKDFIVDERLIYN